MSNVGRLGYRRADSPSGCERAQPEAGKRHAQAPDRRPCRNLPRGLEYRSADHPLARLSALGRRLGHESIGAEHLEIDNRPKRFEMIAKITPSLQTFVDIETFRPRIAALPIPSSDGIRNATIWPRIWKRPAPLSSSSSERRFQNPALTVNSTFPSQRTLPISPWDFMSVPAGTRPDQTQPLFPSALLIKLTV